MGTGTSLIILVFALFIVVNALAAVTRALAEAIAALFKAVLTLIFVAVILLALIAGQIAGCAQNLPPGDLDLMSPRLLPAR